MKVLILGLVALAPAAAAGSDNALAVLNASLAEASRTEPGLRLEIRAEPGASVLPPGRLPARSPRLGAISYRPKTYAELSPEERSRWVEGGAFRRFLTARIHPPRQKAAFAIAPEEMLLRRPFVFSVPPP